MTAQTQAEGLRLADILDRYVPPGGVGPIAKAAAELRRLHAENEHLQAERDRLHFAFTEWIEKTKWVKAKPAELGMHLADILRSRIDELTKARPARDPLIARQLGEWHEDDGAVAWWAWCGREWAGEPAWVGTPKSSDWPGYHTHWTPPPKFPDDLGTAKEPAP